MKRINYIALLSMLEADPPTSKQWKALRKNFEDNPNVKFRPGQPAEDESGTGNRALPKRQLMTRKEVSEYLGIPEATLTTWACPKAVRIPYIKVGHAVRYRHPELDAWLDGHTVGG